MTFLNHHKKGTKVKRRKNRGDEPISGYNTYTHGNAMRKFSVYMS
jgi:hypothetical protein